MKNISQSLLADRWHCPLWQCWLFSCHFWSLFYNLLIFCIINVQQRSWFVRKCPKWVRIWWMTTAVVIVLLGGFGRRSLQMYLNWSMCSVRMRSKPLTVYHMAIVCWQSMELFRKSTINIQSDRLDKGWSATFSSFAWALKFLKCKNVVPPPSWLYTLILLL